MPALTLQGTALRLIGSKDENMLSNPTGPFLRNSGMGQLTSLLLEWSSGDEVAGEELFPVVYPELRRLAALRMRAERCGHTLQPTALVNEVYLGLADQKRITWHNRAHFFGVAAQLMRRILMQYAERRRALKRGSGKAEVPLDEVSLMSPDRAQQLLDLDRALSELAAVDSRQSQIVELRFFAGRTVEETGRVLGISPATVKREWRLARAWLSASMGVSSQSNCAVE
jgi:RNA polymerase sigma factor (TIGR02999 family)